MNNSSDYTPPIVTSIQTRQNELEALRLLIAQRRLYRRAKRWLGLRWLGMVVIGIGAPVISVLWPSLAVVAASVAGLWLFLGRTLLVVAQTSLTTKAASVQEQFDFYVFQMPDSGSRSTLPSLEDIADIAGSDEEILVVAEREELLDWYPLDAKDDGAVGIAISQRANASYADRLLRTTAIVWAALTVAWIILLIVVSTALKVSLVSFLLGVVLPVLPSFLDVVQYVTAVWRSATQRRDLAGTIEQRLKDTDSPIDGQDLLVWQERLFDLRKSAPEVPDFLYRLRRQANERAMHSAAGQLRKRSRGKG